MMTATVFWDRIADRYARQPIKNQTAYEQTLDATRAYLKPRDAVLELGAGTGSTALTLARHVARLRASDISERMTQIAEDKRRKAGVENVEFVTAGAGDHILNWESYDAVLAFNLLHLVEDLDATLSSIYAQLRPGGVFISKSACLGDKSVFLRGMIGLMQLFGRAPHVAYFDTAELEAMIRWTGFEVLSSRTFDQAADMRFVVARRPIDAIA